MDHVAPGVPCPANSAPWPPRHPKQHQRHWAFTCVWEDSARLICTLLVILAKAEADLGEMKSKQKLILQSWRVWSNSVQERAIHKSNSAWTSVRWWQVTHLFLHLLHGQDHSFQTKLNLEHLISQFYLKIATRMFTQLRVQNMTPFLDSIRDSNSVPNALCFPKSLSASLLEV